MASPYQPSEEECKKCLFDAFCDHKDCCGYREAPTCDNCAHPGLCPGLEGESRWCSNHRFKTKKESSPSA